MKFVIFCSFLMFSFLFGEPQAVYLTLPEDSAHGMSVHWIEKKQKGTFDVLCYQKSGDSQWKKAFVRSSQVLGGSSYLVKECLIENLEVLTEYFFFFEGGFEKFIFRTLPLDLSSEIKIAIGGDFMEATSLFRKMNKLVSQKNPDFAILGGDIAYACGRGLFNGKHGSVEKWVDFFKEWQLGVRGVEGRLIPVVPVVGNHDVTAADRKEKGSKALFLDFFPSEKRVAYQSLDIAGGLSLFLLDSGHLSPVNKKQELWLEGVLKQKESMQWKVPVYHVAAYPSTAPFGAKCSPQIRKYWVPLFEKYDVRLVFENHNHAYKRTYPLLKGKTNSKGIVYIGDGCWGVCPRKVESSRAYLEKSESSNCFSLLSVEKSSLKVEVFNEKNELIDKWDLNSSEL